MLPQNQPIATRVMTHQPFLIGGPLDMPFGQQSVDQSLKLLSGIEAVV